MSHWIMAPVLLPALAAVAMLLLPGLADRSRRALGLASVLALLAVSLYLGAGAAQGAHQVYALGDWPAPFGIVLVLDRLSALMLILTSVVALASLLCAIQGWDARGSWFHPLFQFQLMGLNGAFLTGDLFNLFVFFEVLLIASYGLLLHGGGAVRLRAGFHYVTINLVGSALFLIAAALIYGVAGTLNLADLALKMPALEEGEAALARAGTLLLLMVFGVKAAVFPLHFWLPDSYGAASAPAAALFSVMTKVGVYAIVRVFTLGFGADPGAASPLEAILLPAALLTLGLATAGALAGRSLRELAGYLTIASVGTILTAVGLSSAEALAAALYYMVHSTLATAALFVLADLIARQRGAHGDRIEHGPPLAQPALLGSLFLALAAAAAGMPPLSGFVGKLMVLQSAAGTAAAPWVWSLVLASGLLALIALARAGSFVFWSVRDGGAPAPAHRASAGELVPAALLLGCLVALAALAEPVKRFADRTSAQLLDRAIYARGTLGAAAGTVSVEAR